ncbi:MAG: zinc ribbon domain-containing protein [Ruminococcus sp.]|nr:zinc ribbon domain-containing protein [Ruminococcus sp.]
MFCKNCGNEITNGTFCPKCGTDNSSGTSTFGGTTTPYGTPVTPVPTPKKKNNLTMLISLVAILVVVVLLICLVGNALRQGNGSAKSAVKQYYKAFEKQSASKLLDCVPNDILSDIKDEYDLSNGELKDAVEDYLDDYYDDIDKIKIDITKVKKYGDSKLDDFIEEIDEDDGDAFDYDKFEPDKIKAASTVKYDYEVYTDDEDDDGEGSEIAFKYGGRWYCYSAVSDVLVAAYWY